MTFTLRDVLQCPNCAADSLDQSVDRLSCTSCHSEFPVLEGIPDLRIYASARCKNDFNEIQACHEREVHDVEAQGIYEESVIRIYGTKTRMLAEDWCRDLADQPAQLVLDYGCGTGQISSVLKHHAATVFAFDISSVSVQKNVTDNGVTGVLANSFYLPFKDDSFDLICINGVLHHIVDLERAVEEIARVAKKTVCISEGVPRPEPSLSRALSYPGVGRKICYALYVCAFQAGRFLGKLQQKFAALVDNGAASGAPAAPAQGGSIYERALDVQDVESLFLKCGFKRGRLRFFTNIDIPGNGPLKGALTRGLVCDKIGTHFDLTMHKG